MGGVLPLCRGTVGVFYSPQPTGQMSECEYPNKYATCCGAHPFYARYCKSWRKEKKILSKYKSNIPYYEARKVIVEFNTTTYSQTVQHGKEL